MQPDVRWVQRFQNYQKALTQLNEAVTLSLQRALSPLEQQGMIQAFEYTHELAWKTLKDFLKEQGVSDLYGSKDVTRRAFTEGLISDGEVWIDMIEARNLSSHTYNESIARELVEKTVSAYVQRFLALEQVLNEIARS